MAKGKTRTVYRKAKATYKRAKSSNMFGKFKPAIAGGICGAGSNIAQGYLGEWAQPAVCGAVGYFMNDRTAMFMAGYGAGNMLTSGGGNGVLGGMVR